MHDESPGVDQHTAYPKARFLRVLTGKLMHDGDRDISIRNPELDIIASMVLLINL
jgi:hypothetical protein